MIEEVEIQNRNLCKLLFQYQHFLIRIHFLCLIWMRSYMGRHDSLCCSELFRLFYQQHRILSAPHFCDNHLYNFCCFLDRQLCCLHLQAERLRIKAFQLQIERDKVINVKSMVKMVNLTKYKIETKTTNKQKILHSLSKIVMLLMASSISSQ